MKNFFKVKNNEIYSISVPLKHDERETCPSLSYFLFYYAYMFVD